MHGVPWAGDDPEEIVATLRMPEGKARDIRFQDIPPGQGYFGGGRCLVLRFNPPAGVNIRDDCRATRPLPVMAPPDDRFTVTASYCEAADWLIHARLDAGVDAEDWLAYYLAMEELLGEVFREN